jgi:two-component system sensor histidine kinase DesK
MLAFLAILLQREAGDLLTVAPQPQDVVPGIALTIAICLVYGWFWLRVAGSADWVRGTIAVVGLTLLVTAFTFDDPNRSYPFYYPFYYCALVAGAAFSWRPALIAVLAVIGVATAVVVELHGRGVVAVDLITVLTLLGLGALAVRRHVSNFVQLRIARDEIRRMAVAEERLRLARDLHDQLGQSLSTVVLQSELVALELPEDASEATRTRIRTVVDTARSALESMRSVVAGYRQPDLEEELDEARTMLEASGIRCEVEHPGAALPPQPASTLAWVVREAATNIVRHSSARRAIIALSSENGLFRLRVEDDGRGTAELRRGYGLAGVKERAEAAGGTLDIESRAGKGFVLAVEIPARH